MDVQVEIRGLRRVLQKLSPDLLNAPARRFFERASIAVQREARTRAPVDVGHLRSHIGYELDDGRPPLWARVGVDAPEGSPLWYKARAMEWGTGRMGDPGVSHKSGHWPPGAALEVWARRHGFQSGYQVAAIIGKRGGLKARRYLRDGLEAARGAIGRAARQFGEDIKRQWGR